MEERRSENVQAMITPTEKQQLTWLADQEQRTVSEMLRVLMLHAMKIWIDSNPGRKRRLP